MAAVYVYELGVVRTSLWESCSEQSGLLAGVVRLRCGVNYVYMYIHMSLTSHRN